MGLGRWRLCALVLAVALLPLVYADAKQDIADKLCDIVNLVKYVAGAVAILALAFVGVEYMAVGSNPIKREELKTRLLMIIGGMFIILISNYIVAIFLPSAANCPLI